MSGGATEAGRRGGVGVGVRCRVESASVSGKAPGRPRVLGDAEHAESMSEAARKRVCSAVVQCIAALEGAVGWCVALAAAAERAAASASDDALDVARHALNCSALGLLESHHALRHASEYAQQNKVMAAALCSQALEVRQGILPALVEARRVHFKRGGAAQPMRADHASDAAHHAPSMTGGLFTPSAATSAGDDDGDHDETATTGGVDDSVRHAESRRDSCEILARSAIRRTRASRLRAHAHELKVQRRREQNIYGELKYAKTAEAQTRLRAELCEVVSAGPVFREREMLHQRLRRQKLARSRQMFMAGAYASAQAGGGATRMPPERLKLYREHLERIRARAFPERGAPSLHVVGEWCMCVVTAMDALDSALHGLAARARLEGDRAGCAMAALDAACGIVAERASTGAGDDRGCERLRALLQDGVGGFARGAELALQHALDTVRGVQGRMESVEAAQTALQRWYNAGEAGLKTAFCMRETSAVQVYARGNVPRLGDMFRYSMLHGVRRVVNRDDETVPLPSSSFSAERTQRRSGSGGASAAIKQSVATTW